MESSLDITIIFQFHSLQQNFYNSFLLTKNGRNGFCCANGRRINQLDACQLADNVVLHIHMEICDDEMTDCFIQQLPNPSTWKISNSDKMTELRQLDKCFKNLETFIEAM